jgi:hypothetical protein
MNPPVDRMDLSLNYPVFSIFSSDCESGKKSVVSVQADANDCILLYRSRELAELYIEQAQQTQTNSTLEVFVVKDNHELQAFLSRLPAWADHVLWDATVKPKFFKLVSVLDLLEVIQGGAE